jgi:hypothetical protein
MKNNKKGGSGKKTKTPEINEIERIDRAITQIQYIKYMDHVVYRNTSPESVKLSERETFGWVTKENDDYVHICWDKPTWLQRNEICDNMSGMKIHKKTILERVVLTNA